MEDYERVLFADATGQIVWNPETQRYDLDEINEVELDQLCGELR
ncbi:hypothetical protein [Saccharomonospora piscinae]|nr:hypothetical protein [Saccharomonospora piscinae]